jgi:hypothetical protein
MQTGNCAITDGQCRKEVYVLSCQCSQATVSMLRGAVQNMSQKMGVLFRLFTSGAASESLPTGNSSGGEKRLARSR